MHYSSKFEREYIITLVNYIVFIMNSSSNIIHSLVSQLYQTHVSD